MIHLFSGAFVTFALLAQLLLMNEARAYIPHSATIAGRLAKTHGKGLYAIEQEVQFRTSAEPVVLRERWIVENGDSMRLSVSAPLANKGIDPIRYEVVYQESKRVVSDPVGGAKTLPLSPEFIESFFHARTGKTFLNDLIRARIVSPAIMKDRPRIAKSETEKGSRGDHGRDHLKSIPEPQVRLGRTSGSIAWVFGEPSPAEGKVLPQAWVEQDAFLLRRIRFPSEAELTADRHSVYVGSLKLPRERTITWDTHSATIRVVSVKALSPAAAAKLLDPSSIANVKNARLPELAQVREFYTRFR